MTNPWAVFARDPNPDPTPEPLYQSVGMALTAWETMDGRLGFLFNQLTASRDGAAGRAYGTVLGHASRRNMINAAADAVLRDDANLLKRLKKAVNHIANDWSPRRTEIAHGVVTQFSIGDRDLGYYLVPASYSTKHNDLLKNESESDEDWLFDPYGYAYTSAQINAYAKAFQAQRETVKGLLLDVRSFLTSKLAAS